MKQILCIFLIAYMITGCQKGTTTVQYTPEKVASYMNRHPDSALSLLNSISAATQKGMEHADYNLFYTQTCGKNLIHSPSDSLIQMAVDYYKNKEDHLKATGSYYYLECINRDLNQTSSTTEAWLAALKRLPKHTHDQMLILIYNNLTAMYNDLELLKGSIEMYRKGYASLNNELEISKKELQVQQRMFHYTLGGMITGILFFVFAFYHYKGKKNREEKLKKQTKQFDNQIEILNPPPQEHGVESLEANSAVNKCPKGKIQECINLFQQSGWDDKLSTLTPMQEFGYMSEAEQLALYKTLDTIFACFIGSLRKETPHISKEDIYFCTLAMVGYSTKTIAYCIRLSTSALRTRKNRMKKKLSKETFTLFFGAEE